VVGHPERGNQGLLAKDGATQDEHEKPSTEQTMTYMHLVVILAAAAIAFHFGRWHERQRGRPELERLQKAITSAMDALGRDKTEEGERILRQCFWGVELTIEERVEAHFYGDVRHREGDFLCVAAEILGMTQEEVDAAVAAEKKRGAHSG
jgi:hypothetical protein